MEEKTKKDDESIPNKVFMDKLESMEKLMIKVQDTLSSFDKHYNSYQSKNTDQLNTALAEAMKNYKPINCNRENPYYSDPYADLNAIMSIIRPILADNQLSVTQRTLIAKDNETILETRLWHSSGQWIESRSRIIPTKNDLHSYGSSLQYNKRYQLSSLLGITIESDLVDDDAEIDMSNTRERVAKGTDLNIKYNKKKESFKAIKPEQLEQLEYELGSYSDLQEQILDSFRIQTLADLPQSKYETAITRLREIKESRKRLKRL